MFEKLYEKLEWVNGSVSKTTPINKDNLNRIENGIDQLDDRVVELGNNTKKITFATEEPETVENDTIVMVYEE